MSQRRLLHFTIGIHLRPTEVVDNHVRPFPWQREQFIAHQFCQLPGVVVRHVAQLAANLEWNRKNDSMRLIKTHYGDDINPSQHQLRSWFVDWRHQTITRTNVDLSSLRPSDNPLRPISHLIHQLSINKISLKITYLKFNSNLPRFNKLTLLNVVHELHGVSNHQHLRCLFNSLKLTPKPHILDHFSEEFTGHSWGLVPIPKVL